MKTSMTKEQEALKLALEALVNSRVFVTSREMIKHPEGTEWYDERITAIKAALAQPDAFEQGRQEGMKQERALWELTKLGQEIEAQSDHIRDATKMVAQAEERNFCPRCGKRLASGFVEISIHTYTPPETLWGASQTSTPEQLAEQKRQTERLRRSMDKMKTIAAEAGAFYGLPNGLEKRQTSGGNGVTAGETAPTKEIDPNQWAFDRGLEST